MQAPLRSADSHCTSAAEVPARDQGPGLIRFLRPATSDRSYRVDLLRCG